MNPAETDPLTLLKQKRKIPSLWEGFGFSTRCVHAGQAPDLVSGAVNTPISMSTTFAQESPGVTYNGYEYSRTNNPTREAFEACIASLEGCKFGLAYASGCAATSNMLALLSPGDHIVSSDDVYGGTYRIFNSIAGPNQSLEFTFVDTTDLANVVGAIRPNTKLVWIESPTNPNLKITDIEGAANICKERGITLLVDNTFASPSLQLPVKLGATVVMHSVTKYLGGHSDTVMGAMVTNDEDLHKRLKFVQNSLGCVPSPFDCYLAIRGIKTLDIRMNQHSKNGLAVAQFLEEHPKVEKVVYPGLPSHPQHEIAKKQMRDFGGIVTVLLKGGIRESRQFLENTNLFICAESLGAVESLLDHPAIMTHASVPPEVRQQLGIYDSMVRISVGIENIEDIISDLSSGLDAITLEDETQEKNV